MAVCVPIVNMIILALFAWYTVVDGTMNTTLIETLRVNDNSNVQINAYIPQSSILFFKNVVEPLTNLMINQNKENGTDILKLVGTVEISRNSNISVNILFDDKSDENDPSEGVIKFFSELFNAFMNKVEEKTSKPFDIRRIESRATDPKCNVAKHRCGHPRTSIEAIFKSLSEIINDFLGKMEEDEKGRMLDNIRIASTDEKMSGVILSDADDVMKSTLEPLVDKISDTISTIIKMVPNESTKLLETLKNIRKYLKSAIAEESNDLQAKLKKIKGTAEKGEGDISERLEDSNFTTEIKLSLVALKAMLVQLRDTAISYIT